MKGKDAVLFKDEEFVTPEACTSGGVLDCVSVAINENGIGVRSTRDETKSTLVFSHEEWRNFVASVRAGHFSA